MLNRLFGSKARIEILKLFLLNGNQKFYIREISRNLKLQVNSVRRELDNLEKFGLLISKVEKEEAQLSGEGKKVSKQDKKYYSVNQKFVLYEEIKALIIGSQVLLGYAFVNKLKKICSPKLFLLTGMFVNNPNLPIDMLLVGRVSRKKFEKLIADLEKEVKKEINYTIMDQQEFQYRKDMTDIFLFNILESKNLVLIDQFK